MTRPIDVPLDGYYRHRRTGEVRVLFRHSSSWFMWRRMNPSTTRARSQFGKSTTWQKWAASADYLGIDEPNNMDEWPR